MWDRVEHDFGLVSKGSKVKTNFNYLGTKPIKDIEPNCNCVSYNLHGNVLTVLWNISNTSKVESSKIILIEYQDNSIDDLTLKAQIKQ